MKALRFIWALFKYILWGEEVTHEVKDHRLSICHQCPHRLDKNCGICGCSLERKARWSSESCPKKKW